MKAHNFHMAVQLTAHLTPNIAFSFVLSHVIVMVWKSASSKVHALDATRNVCDFRGWGLVVCP